MELGRPGRIVAQVTVSIVAIAAALVILLPSPIGERGLLQPVMRGIADISGFASCGLALAVLWLQPRHEAAPTLALTLALAALAYGLASARPAGDFTEVYGLSRAAGTGLFIGTVLLTFAGMTRLSTLFPRPVDRAEVEAAVRRRPARRTADARGGIRPWQRFMMSGDRRFVRLILTVVPVPRRARRRLARKMLGLSRLLWLAGQPVPLGGIFGLPWTAWSVGLVFALASALFICFFDRSRVAMVFGGALATVLWAHWAYFAIAFRLADATERRKSLWLLVGVLIGTGLVMVAGLLAFSLDVTALLLDLDPGASRRRSELMLAAAATLGWPAFLACTAIAIFRDGLLDPALVIRKTTLYTLVAAALSVAFVVFEIVAARLLAAQVQFAADFGPALAAAGVAATFRPAHKWLERATRGWLDRVVPATALAEGQRMDRVVVFSDLCGYTGLTATDERSALTLASLFHKKARRLAEEHGGRLVKTIGDAVLLEFSDVERALLACRALPAAVAAAAETLELPKATLRTGMHFGEVVRAPDGDLFGGTVNLAARLQTTAAPGELIVSDAIARNRAAPSALKFEHVGARALKNVPQPVDCYRVAPA